MHQFPDLGELMKSLLVRPAFKNCSSLLLLLVAYNEGLDKIVTEWMLEEDSQFTQFTSLAWDRVEDLAIGTIDRIGHIPIIDPEARSMAVSCRDKLISTCFEGLAIGCAGRSIRFSGVGGKITNMQIVIPFVTWCPKDLSQDILPEMIKEIIELSWGHGNKITSVNTASGPLELVNRGESPGDRILKKGAIN